MITRTLWQTIQPVSVLQGGRLYSSCTNDLMYKQDGQMIGG